MNAFNKRFFLWIALIFLGFTAISLKIKNYLIFPSFVAFIVIFGFVLSKSRRKKNNLKLMCALLIAAALLGSLCPVLLSKENERKVEKYTGMHNISGYVLEVSTSENFASEYILRVEQLDKEKASFDLVLVADYKVSLTRGDFITFNGVISSLEEYKDILYLKNKNSLDYPIICAIDEKVEIEHSQREFRIPLMLSDLNSKLSGMCIAFLGKKAGTLASALLLGNRELLSDSVLRDFGRAGVYHMLALSGLHVAILIGIVDWLLKKSCVMRTPRICILSFLSLFYIALTGFALSACRSMLMLWIVYLSQILGKKRDTMTALFAAVFIIVLFDPPSILDVGLQLSFFSTFGVISASIISSKIKWFKRSVTENTVKNWIMLIVQKLALINLASLCVFISTLPLLMVYFGEVSLATFVSNIFMGVVCEIFMIFSLLALLLSFSPYLRLPFAEISVRVGELMLDTVSRIADVENVMLSLMYPRIEVLVWGLFISFLILLAIRISRKWLIFVPSIIFAVLLPINIVLYKESRDDFVRTEYVVGDSVIFSSADEVFICDASDGLYSSFYESIEIAKENCFTEIDGVILTHYHSRHTVSLQRLVKNYKIDRVLLPMPQNPDESLIMRSIARVLKDEGVNVCIYENGRELDILCGKLVISPRAYNSKYSHPSVALSFAYGDDRITVVEKPYFDTYLEESGIFDGYINTSDYLIFGSDGRNVQDSFEIFSSLKNGCEISFAEFDFMNKSDFEKYLDKYSIYFDVEYKKYDLK